MEKINILELAKKRSQKVFADAEIISPEDMLAPDKLVISSNGDWDELVELAKEMNLHHRLTQRLMQKKPTLFIGSAGNILFTSLNSIPEQDQTGVAAKSEGDFWFRDEEKSTDEKLNNEGFNEWPGKVSDLDFSETEVNGDKWVFSTKQAPVSWDFEQGAEIIDPPKTLFSDNKDVLVAVDNGDLAAIIADIRETPAAGEMLMKYLTAGEFL